MTSSHPSESHTSLLLVIGDPIVHSKSPRMHNAAYKATNMQCFMTASQVKSEALPEAIAGVRALGIRGLAVTMPHKGAVCALVDRLDPIAREIGAVNTILNEHGVLTGFNTDWTGIQRPLERRGSLSQRRVALLGAGGAAQAALYACRMKGASVTVFGRTDSKVAALAQPSGAQWQSLNETTSLKDFDIIINTTPVGMGDLVDYSPLSPSQLSGHQTVFETIYAPRCTKLLHFAQQAGCQVIYGHEMFLEQGVAQFEIHTGVEAPREAMTQALQEEVSSS